MSINLKDSKYLKAAPSGAAFFLNNGID